MTTDPRQPPPEALPADVHERVYAERVRREILETTSTGDVREPAPSSEQIQVVVLSGRPAVGKTKIKDLLLARLLREPAAISGDDIGTLDPRWPDLLRKDDLTAGSVVYYDSRKMVARAIEECLQRRFDFLVDTNSDNLQRTRDLLTRFRAPDQNGRPLCRVWFVGVSTAQAMADLAVLARLQQERETLGGGRYVDNADRGYPGVLQTAAMVEREFLADETYVFGRGESRPAYSNVLVAPDRYLRPPGSWRRWRPSGTNRGRQPTHSSSTIRSMSSLGSPTARPSSAANGGRSSPNRHHGPAVRPPIGGPAEFVATAGASRPERSRAGAGASQRRW